MKLLLVIQLLLSLTIVPSLGYGREIMNNEDAANYAQAVSDCRGIVRNFLSLHGFKIERLNCTPFKSINAVGYQLVGHLEFSRIASDEIHYARIKTSFGDLLMKKATFLGIRSGEFIHADTYLENIGDLGDEQLEEINALPATP